MTLPDDMINQLLDLLLNGSNPGDILHSLHVIRTDPADVGPLGIAAAPKVYLYGIAADADGPGTPLQLIDATLRHAAAEADQDGHIIQFAVLGMELWGIDPANDTGHRPLHEQDGAYEVTLIYAACRDGRRWRGRRVLTGPDAEDTVQPEQITGPVHVGESGGIPAEALILRLVGIPA